MSLSVSTSLRSVFVAIQFLSISEDSSKVEKKYLGHFKMLYLFDRALPPLHDDIVCFLLLLLFWFVQTSPSPGVSVIVISIISTSPVPITNFQFQAAVPKVHVCTCMCSNVTE